MLPIEPVARRIDEPLQLAERLGQHGGVELLADNPVAPPVLFEQRRCETVVSEPSAALPAHGLGDAAGPAPSITFQPRNDMRVTMLAQLDHDPAPPHLWLPRRSCRTGKEIKNPLPGICSKFQDRLISPSRFLLRECHTSLAWRLFERKSSQRVVSGSPATNSRWISFSLSK